MRFLAPVVANLLLVLSAFGWGGLLRPFIPAYFSRIDRSAMIPLAGVGIQGLLLFLLGLFRFTPKSMLLVLVPGAILGLRCLRREIFSEPIGFQRSAIPAIPGVLTLFVLLLTFLGGLSQPYGSLRTVDSISYHYLGPKVWLRVGIIRPVFDECLTAFPATVDIQYAPLLAFGTPSGPAFFSVIALLLMLVVLGSLALRCGLKSSQVWWAIAVAATMPAVYRGLYDGMIDVIYACFLLMAARIALDAVGVSNFALAGLFCGFAMGAKYTGLVSVPLLCLCVILLPPPNQKRFSLCLLKLLGVGAIVACVVASPWYLRNWIVAGCPIYPPPPVVARFFHVRYLPPEGIEFINHEMHRIGRGLGQDPFHLLMLPFNLTFHTANFEAGAGGIGLVPLAFLPFSFGSRSWDTFAKGLALFGFLMCIAWFYTAQESRYLIQVYLIAVIFAVAGWESVVRLAPRIARVLSALVVTVSISYGLFMLIVARKDDVHSVISSSFAERRSHAEIPFLESFRYLNADPSVGRVLILDPFVPSFYLDKEYLKPLGRHFERPVPELNSPIDALADPQKWNVTHVLDVRWEEGSFQVLDHPKNLELVFEAEGQRIYRVLPNE